MGAHDEAGYAFTPDERDLRRQLRRRRSKLPGFLVAGVAALALAGGLAYMMTGRDETKPDAASVTTNDPSTTPVPEQRNAGASSTPAQIGPPAEPLRPGPPEPGQEAGLAPSAATPQPAPEPAQASAEPPAQTRATPAEPEPVAPPAPAPAVPATAPPPAPRVNAPAPAEVADYLKRARDLIEVGDIGAARLLLERAAFGNDGTALFALAETYDPAVLEQWRVRGVRPNVERALTLYRRALDRGVAEAQVRLDRLR